MLRGWGFVARHIEEERFCLISSHQNVETFMRNTVRTLRLINAVKDVIIADEHLNLESIQNLNKPCVVLYNNVYTQRHVIWLLYKLLHIPQCIVLLVSPFITAVPPSFLAIIPCILWEKSYFTSVPYIASRCPMINKFMEQDRMVLMQQGQSPVLCNGRRNVCCKLNLELFEHEGHTLQLVIHMQRQFRAKRFYATVIQQAVKEWLYRPQTCLGQKIVYRLNCCQKIKEEWYPVSRFAQTTRNV